MHVLLHSFIIRNSIVLPVILRYTDSDYTFNIFTLFFRFYFNQNVFAISNCNVFFSKQIKQEVEVIPPV